MFTTACPKCLSRYDVPDAAAGRRATCRQCGFRFTVPGTGDGSPVALGKPSVALANPFAGLTDPPAAPSMSPSAMTRLSRDIDSDQDASMVRRRPTLLIGGILALLAVLLVGVVGWVAWSAKQDREARAAYEEYQTLNKDVLDMAQLRRSTEEATVATKNMLKAGVDQNNPSQLEREQKFITQNERRADELRLAEANAIQRMNDLERRWGDSWRRPSPTRATAP